VCVFECMSVCVCVCVSSFVSEDERSSAVEECVICLTETEIDLCVPAKRHPPALSREANTDMTKSVIHRLAARGGLQTGVNHIDDTNGPAHIHLFIIRLSALLGIISLKHKHSINNRSTFNNTRAYMFSGIISKLSEIIRMLSY